MRVAQGAIGLLEPGVNFSLGSGRLGRILHPPMGTQRRTEIGRAGFTCRVTAHRDDNIRNGRQADPRLAVQTLGRDALALQERQGSRDVPCRSDGYLRSWRATQGLPAH